MIKLVFSIQHQYFSIKVETESIISPPIYINPRHPSTFLNGGGPGGGGYYPLAYYTMQICISTISTAIFFPKTYLKTKEKYGRIFCPFIAYSYIYTVST